MTTEATGDSELSSAVVREALAQFGAEERALLRVALARAAGEADEDAERMLMLLAQHDAGRGSALLPHERWLLASALRQFRGMSWQQSQEVALVHEPDANATASPTTAGAS